MYFNDQIRKLYIPFCDKFFYYIKQEMFLFIFLLTMK